MSRTSTPDRTEIVDGRTVTHFHLKRCCNGCGEYVGDVEDRDVDDHGHLTDVRAECPNCAPVVALEQAGCRTWQVTPHNIVRVADEIDRLRPWVYTKGYWQSVDGKNTVVGLRVGSGNDRAVAFWGDWLIRHPDGQFTVHTAPKAGEQA